MARKFVEVSHSVDVKIARDQTAACPPAARPCDLLSVQESAAYLGCSDGTIRDWVKRGALPAVWVGARLRFHHADLVAMSKPVEVIKVSSNPLKNKLK